MRFHRKLTSRKQECKVRLVPFRQLLVSHFFRPCPRQNKKRSFNAKCTTFHPKCLPPRTHQRGICANRYWPHYELGTKREETNRTSSKPDRSPVPSGRNHQRVCSA